MNVLCVGDVCGKAGCEYLLRVLPDIKRKNNVDFTVVNGENSADGNGILPSSAELLFSAGADVITGGNHTLRRKEIYENLEENDCLLRPANMPPSVCGKGYGIYDLGRTRIGVINLLGTTYMESMDCPFRTADRIISELKEMGVANIIVDFHAEATSEKKALGYYLDGRVSALFGTHTHIATADESVLPGGTGYITDVGMCGAVNSVLGVNTEIVISKFLDRLPTRFLLATGEQSADMVLFRIDEKTGKCLSARRIKA